jgi:hypothetical protein
VAHDNSGHERDFARLFVAAGRVKIAALLVLCIVLFIVWWALAVGRQRSEDIDKDFCQHIISDKYYFGANPGVALCEVPQTASELISQARGKLFDSVQASSGSASERAFN